MPPSPQLLPSSGEDELIEWLRRNPITAGLLGDDAAVLPPRGELAVTMDTQVSGIHFHSDRAPELIARRLLAVNLSDLAAMGARPTHGFLALSTRTDFDHLAFFNAFAKECEEYGCQLAGGDLSGNRNTTAALTLLGELPAGGRWLRRRAARPGQDLWVGGNLGESALGLALLQQGAHIDTNGRCQVPKTFELSPSLERAARRAVRQHALPRPQLELGQWLSTNAPHAAIDISDGLAKDLHRLCRESGVGATIEWSQIPTPADFQQLCRNRGLPAQELALAGGEDYVLLFTLPKGIEAPANFGALRIGAIHTEPGIQLVVDDRLEELPPMGWDHITPRRQASKQ